MFCLDAIGPIKRRVNRELQENGQIGYEGETPEPMIAEITVEITGSLARVSDYAGSDSPMLIDGNPNLVIWDGTPYRCVTTGSKSNSTSVYIGNVYRVSPDYENTGEPFCIQINRTGGRANVYGEPGTHTLEIQNLVKTITPIDPKYLPSGGGGGLPFVELETVPSFTEGQPATLSERDTATINGIYTSGTKCFVVSVYVQALKLYMTTVLTAVNGEGLGGFVGILPLITDIVSIVISQDGDDGAWIITTANPN